jgi:PAS domain S-box-containing protein
MGKPGEGPTRRLKLTDQRYQQVIDNIQDAVIIDDVDGRVVYANKVFLKLFGLDAKDLENLVLEDYIAPEWRQRLRDRHDRRVRGEEVPSHFRYVGLKKSGERMWLEVSVLKVVEDGKVVGTQSAIRDISSQKKMEEALHSAHETMEELVKGLPLAVCGMDAGSIVTMWNPAAEAMFGWKVEEIVGKPYPLAPDDLNRQHRTMLGSAIREGKIFSGFETVRHRKDGTPVEIAIWSSPLHDSEGKVTTILSIMVDISQRRRAEQDYRRLFDEALDAVIIFDPEGEIVLEVNPRACEMYRLKREEFIGHSLIPLSTDIERGKAQIKKVLAGKPDDLYMTVHKRGDGTELHIESRGARIEYRGRTAIMAITRDVTERKRLEQQLLHAQKMEALGQLAGGIAHDFNNLLTSILGGAEMLLEELPSDSLLREYLTDIDAAAQRGAGLTRQLLAFSRKQVVQRKPMGLHALLSSMATMMERTLEDEITLEIVQGAASDTILGDRGQMEQVILNLVVNARDAMPEGGRLTIETSNVEVGGASTPQTGEVKAGPNVVLSIRDTGTGMNEETLRQVFTPFFTTKPPGRGTGLGLSTVYGIIRQHEGQIFVESKPGRGSTFRVHLPVHEGAAVGSEDRAEGGLSRGTGTILLVEDEPVVRGMAQRVLESAGYRVVAAADAEEAERHFASNGIDLLLTDVLMPGRSGPELSESLRKRKPDLPVIFMSGYVKDERRRGQVKDAPFLSKPFTPSTLTAKVREILDAKKA